MTVNQGVLGSSPRGGALKIKHLQRCLIFFVSHDDLVLQDFVKVLTRIVPQAFFL